MATRAQLRVSTRGDHLVDGRVESAIAIGGVLVEKVDLCQGSDGEQERRFWLSLSGHRSLDDIVRAVERVRGAAVTAAKALPSAAQRGATRGAWDE